MVKQWIPIKDPQKEREVWLRKFVMGVAEGFLAPSRKVRKELKKDKPKRKRVTKRKKEKRKRVTITKDVSATKKKYKELFDSEKWKNWSGHDKYAGGPIPHPQLRGGFTKKTKQWAKDNRKGFIDVRIKGDSFIRPLTEEYPIRVKRPIDIKQGFFGSYPAPVGIHRLYNLELSPNGFAFLTLNPNLITNFIHRIRYFFRVIQIEAEKVIMKKVPSDTGMLRKSFIKSVSDQNSIFPKLTVSSLSDLKISMRWFSELEYAGIVNKMPTGMVRHHRNQKIRSWRTGKFLHDPEAVGMFFYTVKYDIQRKIRNELYPQFLKSMYGFLKNVLANLGYQRILNLGTSGVANLFKSKTV